jgi:hypothetical protein
MGKENNSQSGSFTGINIATLEEDLGMIIPGTGESPGTEKKDSNDEQQGSEKKVKSNLDLSYFSQKMAIPETEEEIKAAKGEVSEDDESGEGKEIKKKQGKGGEDAIIKEDSPLYLHAATLHEEGILPTLDLESLKGKSFKEGMQLFLTAQTKYIEDGRNEYLNSLSDRQKEFLEMIELGIPQEQVEHQFTIEDAYSKVSDQVLSNDTELQKQMIIQGLKLKGLTDTKIQVFLKASTENETEFEDAKEARDDINVYIANQKQVVIDNAKSAQQETDQREQDLQKEIKSTIEKIDEILPGIKISANEKTKLNDLMTKPIEEKIINGRKVPINLINKTRMEDRVQFDLKLNYYIQLGLFGKDIDTSKLIKKVTSTAADKLSARLNEEAGGTTGRGIRFERPDDTKKEKIIFPQFK